MEVKISATFEGRCSICKKKTKVFTAGDEDTHKTVSVCKKCADKLGNKPVSQVIEEYGIIDDEAFKKGIRIEKKK